MKKNPAIAAISLVLVFLFIACFIFLRSGRVHQEKITNTIRVLIDRAPGGLLPGQAVDVMGRRFLPLLDEYRLEPQRESDEFELAPRDARDPRPHLLFTVIRDESTRTMKFLRGEGDILYDTLAISKTEWVRRQAIPGVRIYSRSGLNLSYIGFSLRHPVLKHKGVRLAIAQALPVQDWIRYKLLNWVDRSQEWIDLPYDPAASEAELDRLGYPRGPSGEPRFQLKYYTTGVREGAETALLVQDALRRIGIELEIVMLDTLLYFEKMRKGEADLFSTRWFRFSEQESIADYLSTGGNRNYFGYSNPSLDQRLKKNPVLTPAELTKVLREDFPFFPLYNWRHGLIVGPRIQVENETQVSASLDESFRFLALLRLR